MKNSKKGISLIVLIITIIVIIILATAILVSVISNNPISEANKARYESDRDNMQAVFTNTVEKIMSKELGTVNVTAGQINTETTGVSETAGEVVYTVNNAMISANASGKIVFDKGTNDATTYYTGKKLPIYAAGETKWYVDSEGVLSLEVAGVKYGNGEIVLTYKSLGNYEHETSDGIIESHDTENGICSKCGENVLIAGTYDSNGNLLQAWNDLGLNIEEDTIPPNSIVLSDEAIKLVVPEGITRIGNYQFSCMINGSNKLKEILLPETITSIGYSAFSYCGSLINITIPNSVTSIGSDSFSNCSNLASITIPNGVKNIESNTFSHCASLKEIKIPNSVIFIGERAFLSCSNLTSVVIPSSVTTIAKNPFSGCNQLKSIIVSPENSVYDSRENCNAIINSQTNTLISGCEKTIVPDGVVTIGYCAFADCTGLTSLVLPNSVTSIMEFAFDGCTNLTEITMPDTVSSIGIAAFQNCSALKSINIPYGIKEILGNTFTNCTSLTNITIPDSVTFIGELAFSGCTGLKSFYIPTSVTTMSTSSANWAIFTNCLSTMKIYCGASEKQSGWGTYWNYSGSGKILSVTYGITREQYETTYKQ